MEFTKSEAKQWAREHYKGLEGAIMPSFTPDLAQLDEEGIRHDVRHFINQEFFSILCAPESTAMTLEECKKFFEIVCDEAKGKISVSMAMLLNTIEQDMELLMHFEKVGGIHALVGHPVQYYPESEEDIYQTFKEVCDSTNLAIDIYPSAKSNFGRFHQSQFNLKLLERLADIPNAVAMKVGGGLDITAYAAEAFRLVGDKILVQCPQETMWPITVPKYGQQWAGAAPYDMFQSPDNPQFVNYFNLLGNGDINRAMDIYWKLTPSRNAYANAFMLYGAGGCYPFTLWKYWQWLVGGNGGMLRQPSHRLYEHDKEKSKAAMRAAGITVREAPEEEFYVGRVNYAKGARLKVRAKA
jgi:4-hydroxy-tetrahydrodipicolinate synthase